VALLLFLGALPSAMAQELAGIRPRALFDELDANSDRAIIKAEVPESGQAAFGRLLKLGDSNGNNRLELAEFQALVQNARGPAAAPGAISQARFNTADKDGDGRLSQAEFPGPKPLFQRLDRDADGFVSRQEARPATPAVAGTGPAARFASMDRDHDGKLDRGEFLGPAPRFMRMDADHDGTLSRQEFVGFLNHEAAAAASPARLTQRFKTLDRNQDGKLSRTEFPGADAGYARLDANHDGGVTLEEFLAGRAGGSPARSAPKTP
jgi:Ca2+-binding EF-hand superfamily protein